METRQEGKKRVSESGRERTRKTDRAQLWREGRKGKCDEQQSPREEQAHIRSFSNLRTRSHPGVERPEMRGNKETHARSDRASVRVQAHVHPF